MLVTFVILRFSPGDLLYLLYLLDFRFSAIKATGSKSLLKDGKSSQERERKFLFYPMPFPLSIVELFHFILHRGLEQNAIAIASHDRRGKQKEVFDYHRDLLLL